MGKACCVVYRTHCNQPAHKFASLLQKSANKFAFHCQTSDLALICFVC